MARISGALCLLACLLLSARAASVRYDAAIASAMAAMNVHAESLRAASQGRSLLQGDGDGLDVAQCTWNGDDGVCGLSPLVALDFVGQAPPSPIKDMLLNLVECSLTVTEDDCKNTETTCAWEEGQCVATADVSDTESIADCVGKEVAAFLDPEEDHAKCLPFKDADTCNIQNECGWAEVGGQKLCSFDIWKFLTGVPSTFGEFPLPRGLEQIVRNRSVVLEQAVEDANVADAKAILDVPVPAFTCPDGVDYVVCSIAEETDVFLLTQIYCQERYARDKVCEEDQLCGDVVVVNNEEHCEPADGIFLAMRVAQREQYLEAISDPVAKAIMRTSLLCLETGTRGGECKEGCVWEDQLNACTLGPSALFKELSVQPVQRGGIRCQVVQGIFRTGCMSLDTQEACASNDLCAWDEADGFCTAGPLAYLNFLFSDDRSLQIEAAEAGFECLQKTNADDCISV